MAHELYFKSWLEIQKNIRLRLYSVSFIISA